MPLRACIVPHESDRSQEGDRSQEAEGAIPPPTWQSAPHLSSLPSFMQSRAHSEQSTSWRSFSFSTSVLYQVPVTVLSPVNNTSVFQCCLGTGPNQSFQNSSSFWKPLCIFYKSKKTKFMNEKSLAFIEYPTMDIFVYIFKYFFVFWCWELDPRLHSC